MSSRRYAIFHLFPQKLTANKSPPFIETLTPILFGAMRRLKNAILPVVLLLAFCSYLSKVSADTNITFVIENSRGDEIIPRMVVSPGRQRIDYPAVQSNGTRNISLEHDSHLALFFATGCSQINHQVKCISGDCPQVDCVKKRPLATTMIDYNNGTLAIGVSFGFNVGIKVLFLGLGCDRPSVSCVLALEKCSENEKMWQDPEERGKPRVLMACKNVTGISVPSGEDCTMRGSYDVPSAWASCEFPNAVWKVIVT